MLLFFYLFGSHLRLLQAETNDKRSQLIKQQYNILYNEKPDMN